jgi:hypothetical protein
MAPPPETNDPYLLFTPTGPNTNSEGVAVAWDNVWQLWMTQLDRGQLDLAYIQEFGSDL